SSHVPDNVGATFNPAANRPASANMRRTVTAPKDRNRSRIDSPSTVFVSVTVPFVIPSPLPTGPVKEPVDALILWRALKRLPLRLRDYQKRWVSRYASKSNGRHLV